MGVLARLRQGAPTLARAGASCQPALRSLVDSLLFGSLPCRFCGAAGQPRRALCSGCEADLPWLDEACPGCALPTVRGQRCGQCISRPPCWEAARAPVRYDYPADWLVRRLKFGGDLAMAPLMAALMASRKPAFPGSPPVLAPVPLHRSRLLRRGYDQAREIAAALAGATGLRLESRLLRRQRATSPQVGLGAAARRRNLAGAFEVRRRNPPPAVCLVDDVLTTGATAATCTAALRRAGVERVFVWCFARAEGPD